MLRIKLSPAQRSELQELRRDKSLKPAERDRVEMVFLADAGWTVAQIAEHLECHPQTVRRLFARYEQARAAAIRHRPPGPEPDRARREQVEAALRSELARPRTWSSRDLATTLREHGIALSARQVRKYLRGMGARYRRTARTLAHKQDPARVAATTAELERLKNALRPAS